MSAASTFYFAKLTQLQERESSKHRSTDQRTAPLSHVRTFSARGKGPRRLDYNVVANAHRLSGYFIEHIDHEKSLRPLRFPNPTPLSLNGPILSLCRTPLAVQNVQDESLPLLRSVVFTSAAA